jgi:hypothetical protein
MKTALAVLALFSIAAPAIAQTLSLDDATVLQEHTGRVGMNIGAIDYYDSGQVYKNLIGVTNPGMEPLLNRQIWILAAAGTRTTFTHPDPYDIVPADYWAGGTFTVVESQNRGPELGCTGTIASNTGPNYPNTGRNYTPPKVTVSAPCAAAFAVGDQIVMSKSTFPTPESWWEQEGHGGVSGSVSGGAKLLSDTTDLCDTCGSQALTLDATPGGSTATATLYYDSLNTADIFVLMKGNFQLSFWAKRASGLPVMHVTAFRGSVNGFNCQEFTPVLTARWVQYTHICTVYESPQRAAPGNATVTFRVTGGAADLDNISFAKLSPASDNPTVLRDEVLSALQTVLGPASDSAPPTLRYWVNQNAETMENWTAPDYARQPSGSGTGYFTSGAGQQLSLEDFLVLCHFLGAVPYLEVPVTFSTADAANLIEFLASPSSTTYGARRAALGQAAPWTDIFPSMHLAFCNECWNSISFAGQNMPDRTSQPNSEGFYDYSLRARDIFAAMRANRYYSEKQFDLVLNAQTAVSYSMDAAIARARPDSIEIADYTYGSVSKFATDAELWQPAIVDPWEKVTNRNDNFHFYQSVHDYQSQMTCGKLGKSRCKVNIYEWGQGTIGGGIDQKHLDYINAGAGEGTIMALQALLNLQYYGIAAQSFFALNEYQNGGEAGLTAKLWGATVDMGGATNNVRPEFLGIELINRSIIGPMYACPIDGNPKYNFAGSPNGVAGMPPMRDVPYLYAFCFKNGDRRSVVLINTDRTESHSMAFAGTHPPRGTVTQRQYAFADPNLMNEAPTGTPTNHAPTTVALTSSTIADPASVTLPPFSVTALDYSLAAAPIASLRQAPHTTAPVPAPRPAAR